jgi:hypothetical protein
MTHAAHTHATAEAALEVADPARDPLPTPIPTSVEVKLSDGRLATVKRRAPRAALKGKIALAKLLGPTLARVVGGGIDVGGKRVEALTLIALASKKGRERAAAEGLDVEKLYAVARAHLPTLLFEALAEVDPEQLDGVIDYYLVGACVVQVKTKGPDGADVLGYTPVLNPDQIDTLLSDDLDLGRLLLEAVTLGLRPFGAGASSSPSS